VKVTTVLLATDSDDLFLAVDAALATADTEVLRVRKGVDVVPVCARREPDIVLLDLQIGNMGGMAASLAVRHAQERGEAPIVPVALLLDRDVDVVLGRQAKVDGWLIKPLDALRLESLVTSLLNHETYFEEASIA